MANKANASRETVKLPSFVASYRLPIEGVSRSHTSSLKILIKGVASYLKDPE